MRANDQDRNTTAPQESAVVSRDGTRIAFERSGDGSAVILVSSALADRTDTARLAALLAEHFTVVQYDRRGRGASGDAATYAVRHEIDDLAALIEHLGGSASLFGSSSGAVLALRAAASGLPVDRLALYEPPFAVGSDGFGPPAGFATRVAALVADNRRSEAVRLFMRQAQGMPGWMVGAMRLARPMWRRLTALAHTLPYDLAVMGDTQRGVPLTAEEWSGAHMPTLVLTGGKSPAGFRDAAAEVVRVLPDAATRSLDGLHHGAVVTSPGRLAPSLIDFLRA